MVAVECSGCDKHPYEFEFCYASFEMTFVAVGVEMCKLPRGFVRKTCAIWQAKDTDDNFVQAPFHPQVATIVYNSWYSETSL